MQLLETEKCCRLFLVPNMPSFKINMNESTAFVPLPIVLLFNGNTIFTMLYYFLLSLQ